MISSAVNESIGDAFPRRSVVTGLSGAILSQLATPIELIGLLIKGVLDKDTYLLVTSCQD